MIELSKGGAYLLNGTEIIEDGSNAAAELSAKLGNAAPSKEEAAKNTIAYGILNAHNTSGSMDKLKIKFDKMTSHDITFVGIIQTARASGLEKFPIPYVLTNCHNSLCAVGGTINEDDHMFGLTCAKKYGGIYVPPHQAVIHQFAREMLAEGGKMILGSDSHTRYGALGTMAMGEGGPELVKQLLNKTYDINMPGVVAIYLTGEPAKGVGPQDVALAIIGAVFGNGYVKNKVMEFVGPGVSNLSADFRIGIDVMTTETTCLSSIWRTDEKIQEFYDIHGRSESYKELKSYSSSSFTVKPDFSRVFCASTTDLPTTLGTSTVLRLNTLPTIKKTADNIATSANSLMYLFRRSRLLIAAASCTISSVLLLKAGFMIMVSSGAPSSLSLAQS